MKLQRSSLKFNINVIPIDTCTVLLKYIQILLFATHILYKLMTM